MAKPKAATEEVAKTETPAVPETPEVTPAVPETPVPASVPAAPVSRSSASEEASYKQTVANMKEFLSKQPTVSIFIPLEPGEPKGTLLPVEMNGYKVKVPKNVYVDVPKSIADIVKESLNVYEEASAAVMSKENGNPMRLDLASGDTKSALNA